MDLGGDGARTRIQLSPESTRDDAVATRLLRPLSCVSWLSLTIRASTIACRQPPMSEEHLRATVHETFAQKHFVEKESVVPADLVDFICRSLHFSPQRRFSVGQLRAHRSRSAPARELAPLFSYLLPSRPTS